MPYKDPERQRRYMAQYRQEHLFEAAEARKTIPVETRRGYEAISRRRRTQTYDGKRGRVFVGADGEGHGEGSAHQMYVFRVGDRQLKTGLPLTTDECLNFIADLPYGPVYCIYYGTYDCTMILRGLPPETIDHLLNRQARAFKTDEGRILYEWTRYKDYRLDYIPKKRLVVARGEKTKSIVIHDVGGFFQEPFLYTKEDGSYDGAVKKWGVATPEELKVIAYGKQGRGADEFDALSDDVDHYNDVECIVLSRLMSELNDATHAVGLEASPFEGAGNLAGSLYEVYVAGPHRKRGEQARPPRPPVDVPSMGAYYGGRFEITAHGPINCPVYEYDICSAYPSAMLRLPCLWHGQWVRQDRPDATVRCGFIAWQPRNHNRNHTLGPLPVRLKGGHIQYPRSGVGWYWDVEWPSTNSYEVDLLDCWSFIPECDHKPYDWIRNVYNARKGMGKSGKGYVLKLALNSLYGKTAQQVGEAPWHNPALAGLITAQTRRWLRDAADQAPDDIVMMATDGIYSLSPLDLRLGSDLGDWEEVVYPDMHIVQPGIYFSGDNAKVKTRGVARRTLIKYRQDIIDAFGRFDPDDPKLDEHWSTRVEYSGLITLKQAWSWNRLDRAGYFGKLERSVSYYCEPKRSIQSLHTRDDILRSYAPTGSRKVHSVPYKHVHIPDHDFEEMIEEAPEELEAREYLLF